MDWMGWGCRFWGAEPGMSNANSVKPNSKKKLLDSTLSHISLEVMMPTLRGPWGKHNLKRYRNKIELNFSHWKELYFKYKVSSQQVIIFTRQNQSNYPQKTNWWVILYVCIRTAAHEDNSLLFSSFEAELTEKSQPCKESPWENKSSFSLFPWPAAASASCGGGVWESLMLHRKGKKWDQSAAATAWWRSLATLGRGAQLGESTEWDGWPQRWWTLLKRQTEKHINARHTHQDLQFLSYHACELISQRNKKSGKLCVGYLE